VENGETCNYDIKTCKKITESGAALFPRSCRFGFAVPEQALPQVAKKAL